MNSTLKISLMILTTLLIGVLLGAVGHGAFMKRHEKKFHHTHPSKYFLSNMEEIIRPDSTQRSRVEEITSRTAKHIDVLFDHHRLEMSMLLDSMKTELFPFLRPDQKERLAKKIRFGEREPHEGSNLGEIIAFSYEYAEHLQQELDLDSTQTERVMAIIHASHSTFRRNLSAANGSAEKAEGLEHTLFDETSRDIQKVLTEKQEELFRKQQHELRHYAEEELKEEDEDRD